MAADQRKRRLSFEEQYNAKRMEFSPLQCEFNFNTHVALRWDDDEKRVVAKEEQIGLSSRHLAPFLPVSSAKVADVVTIPKEVFEMDSLAEVFSYEGWQSVLTESDRSFLTQFLPEGAESDEAVQRLLGGENYHFGSPLVKWSSALCSGDFHPDAVVQHEKSFKANKMAYYIELQQYHDRMLRNLQNLKERCASSRDPEAEILKIMSRAKGNVEKNILFDANGYRSIKLEDNATYESPSSIADEKSYYSDNQKLSTIRDAEIQKRIRNQQLMMDKLEKTAASRNGLKVVPPRAKKTEKLQKANISFNDGTKYMSYVKISKKQHELVKSMKQSGSSIKSKNLDRLLGNLDGFSVKPYEMFVEEEQGRIQEHWKAMVQKDLPVALQRWRNGQSERLHIMNSLWNGLEDKLGHLIKSVKSVESADEGTADAQEADREYSQGDPDDHHDDGLTTQGSMGDTDRESDPSPSLNKSSVQNPLLNVNEQFDLTSSEIQSLQVNVNKELGLSFIQNRSLQNHPSDVDKEFGHPSMENHSLQDPSANMNEELDPSSTPNKTSMDNHPLNDYQEFNSMDLNAESNQVSSEISDYCSMPERHVAQTTEVSISHSKTFGSAASVKVVELPSSSIKQVWSTIGLPESYSDANLATQYTATSGLNIGHSQVILGQPAPLIDLASELPEDSTTKDLLNRHTNHMQFFNPCTSRNRNELLQSILKGDNNHQEPRTAVELHPSNVMTQPTQLPGLFREQMQPSFALDQRPRACSELYMNQNIQNSLYTDSNRFPIQGQEHFTNLNLREWSSTRMSNPVLQSQLSSGGLINHNWFPNDYRAHGGWPGAETTVLPSTSIGSISTGDQSLYSLLSQCNPLHARAPFNFVGPTEQMMPSTSFGPDMAAGIPMTSSPIQHTASPFDYLSGGEAATTLKNPNMGWMSLGRQSSALSDPSGKSFF